MKSRTVDAFLSEITASLKKHFIEYKFEFLLKTPKSLKSNIYLDENPSKHSPCDKPSIDKIISDIKAIYAAIKGGSGHQY